MKTSSLPHVSVAICTNRPGRLLPAVLSVLANSYQPMDLLVVAQGGDWATADLASVAHDARLRIVADDGKGLSRARNLALREAAGELILFTDDDCLAAPGWVRSHVDVYAARPEAALMFGKVVPPEGYSPEHGSVPTFDPGSQEGSWRNTGNVVLGMGANMSLRRSTVAIVGSFDEELGAGGLLGSWEDLDYALRVAAAGLVIVTGSDAPVIHQGGVRAHGVESRQLWRRDGIGMGAVLTKRARARDWKGTLRVLRVASEMSRSALLNLALGRRPTGLRMMTSTLSGAVEGAATTLLGSR